MNWVVEFTSTFRTWWEDLPEPEQIKIDAHTRLLERHGPRLPHPYSSGMLGARTRHLRELRIQHKGRALRVFYAFDPRRRAILLIGGDKTGDSRFYRRMIPLADMLYLSHLADLEEKEPDDGC